jgi:tRNA(Arg) A34 adenosine deaminase TadA
MYYPIALLVSIALSARSAVLGADGQARHDGLAADRMNLHKHWMNRAIQALHELASPCPFSAFGTVIVDYSSTDEGELVCIGVNDVAHGNPTLHGEIAAINNCSAVLTDPAGPYKLTPSEALEKYKQLTLYTTGEPCPMCATAIRWAGFEECVYATTIYTLLEFGWSQINLTSHELFDHPNTMYTKTRLLGGVLSDRTDPLFAWQFNEGAACPVGCLRDGEAGMCSSTPDSDAGFEAEL